MDYPFPYREGQYEIASRSGINHFPSYTVCARADGHFDRINTALQDLLRGAAEGAPMTARAVAECAGRHNVCPYSLSLDAAEFADVIICDYNYVFHPQARLERFFEGRNRSILLIDEAHNLVERGRDLYSAQISYRQVPEIGEVSLAPSLEEDEGSGACPAGAGTGCGIGRPEDPCSP